METADMGLGRPDASVGESGRGEVVVGEVEVGREPLLELLVVAVPRQINSAKNRAAISVDTRRQSKADSACVEPT